MLSTHRVANEWNRLYYYKPTNERQKSINSLNSRGYFNDVWQLHSLLPFVSSSQIYSPQCTVTTIVEWESRYMLFTEHNNTQSRRRRRRRCLFTYILWKYLFNIYGTTLWHITSLFARRWASSERIITNNNCSHCFSINLNCTGRICVCVLVCNLHGTAEESLIQKHEIASHLSVFDYREHVVFFVSFELVTQTAINPKIKCLNSACIEIIVRCHSFHHYYYWHSADDTIICWP